MSTKGRSRRLHATATPTSAATFGWDNGGGDNLWSTSTNWLPDGIPSTNDIIELAASSLTGDQTIDVNGIRRIQRIELDGVDGDYTFTGGTIEIFLLGGNSLLTVTSHNLTVDADIQFDPSNQLFRFNGFATSGGQIVVNGDISPTSFATGSQTLELTGRNSSLSHQVVVSGEISDGDLAIMNLTAGFAGDAANHDAGINVTELNTFTGATRINGAILTINSIENVGGPANALGQPLLANSVINMGTTADADPVRGTLRYVGSGHTTNRDFNLTGKDNDVAAIESSGTGPLVLNSDVTNPANGQILVLGGTNADNNILSGVINPAPGTDVTSIRKEGPGKWILSGMSQHDGGTTVNAGELVITGTIGTVGGVGRMSLGGGTLTIDGATVEQLDLDKTGGTLNFKSGELRLVSNTTAGGAGGMTIGTDGPGVLQLSGGSQVFTNVTLEGTDDRLSMIAGGTYQFTNLDNSAGGIVAAAVPNVQINGGTFTHNVPSGTSNFRARIQGTGGLTKLGDGILTLDGISHTYTGPTRIEAGRSLPAPVLTPAPRQLKGAVEPSKSPPADRWWEPVALPTAPAPLWRLPAA